MSKLQFDLSLYLVTDRSLSLERDIMWIIEEAVKGGVSMVQLREKDCSTRKFIDIATSVKKLLSKHNVPLIINDRVDIAIEVNADGVHIGQSDMPYKIARKLLGRDKIIGLSVENMEQAQQANLLDVDYIGISPVFNTPTKPDTAAAFGLEGLRNVTSFTNHPSVAIGGINLINARDVILTGIKGIAVVSAICSAPDPREAAHLLKKLISC